MPQSILYNQIITLQNKLIEKQRDLIDTMKANNKKDLIPLLDEIDQIHDELKVAREKQRNTVY